MAKAIKIQSGTEIYLHVISNKNILNFKSSE